VLANAAGIAAAFWIAAGGLAAGVLLATLFPMGRNERLDLRPAGHWPAVDDLVPVSDFEDGPVLVTVEYEIDPAKRDEFLALACAGRSARRRDGAFAWGIYEDVENRSRFIEEFRVATWSEHMRQHTRVTRHDQEQEALARAFHIGPDKPRVRHYLAADAPDRGTVRAQDVPN
jgi:quinol monooxygenase YgiN